MAHLQLVRLRLMASHNLHPAGTRSPISLQPEDCDYLVELIDEILTGQNVLKKYWKTLKGRPEADWYKKMHALLIMGTTTTPLIPPTDENFEDIARQTKLSFDVVKHTYRKHLLPIRVRFTKDKSKGQSDK